jgi:hypothetical protein
VSPASSTWLLRGDYPYQNTAIACCVYGLVVNRALTTSLLYPQKRTKVHKLPSTSVYFKYLLDTCWLYTRSTLTSLISPYPAYSNQYTTYLCPTYALYESYTNILNPILILP